MRKYRIGDELEAIYKPNIEYLRTPNNYVVISIDKSKNSYRIQNLQTQKYKYESKENLDLFFRFIRHMR